MISSPLPSAEPAVLFVPVVSLSVVGSTARFPVGRIFCVGRNYAAHAEEMGGHSDREAPFFFAKPGASIWSGWERGEDLPYPVATSELQIGHPSAGALELAVNGEVRQQADLRDQIWPVADTLAHLSSLITLLPGDLIYTGTPAGVSELRPGDSLSCRIERVGAHEFSVGERP